MIKNDKQYKTTKDFLVKFEQALKDFERNNPAELGIDPIIVAAQKEGLSLQINELKEQLREYDEVKNTNSNTIPITSIYDLNKGLIKARIAQKISQKELAKRLQLKEQVIQRYESTEYSGASFSRILEVAKVLEVDILEPLCIKFSDTDNVTNKSASSAVKNKFLLPEDVDHAKILQLEEKISKRKVLLEICPL